MRTAHRDHDPAPRDDGDRPQSTPAVDDPPAPDPVDGRAHRPRRRHRRAVAAARAGRPGREPAAGVGVVHAERTRRRLRGPAVPRVLPADARLHPAVDRHVQHHRREAGALPRAGPGRADPDLGTADGQGRRRPRAGGARRLGDLRDLRGPRLARVRPGAVRGRDRPLVAGRRLPARSRRRPQLRGRRGHRQRPGERPTRRPAGRWRRHRPDHRARPRPGDRDAPRRCRRVHAVGRHRARRVPHRAAGRRPPVRPRRRS